MPALLPYVVGCCICYLVGNFSITTRRPQATGDAVVTLRVISASSDALKESETASAGPGVANGLANDRPELGEPCAAAARLADAERLAEPRGSREISSPGSSLMSFGCEKVPLVLLGDREQLALRLARAAEIGAADRARQGHSARDEAPGAAHAERARGEALRHDQRRAERGDARH